MTTPSRRIALPLLTALLVIAGLGAVVPRAAVAASSSCFPTTDSTISGPGDFTDSTDGSGTGDVSIESGPTTTEGTGLLRWTARQAVAGNTGGPGATMSGDLTFTVTLNGRSVSFASSCILEAGVFAGESEDDPFDPELTHTAVRGIEGEWIGTAYNFPASGQQTKVVASLAVWTTSVGPRYHLDVSTGDFSGAGCPLESDANGSVSSGGPTGSPSRVNVTAPDMQAGYGSCAT